MKEINKEELLDRYVAGTATEAEKALVESWYIKAPFSAKVPDADQLLIDQKVSRDELVKYMQPAGVFKLWPRIAIAAAAVAAIVFGVFLFKAPRNPKPAQGATNYTNDIAPGKNTATLTLANGKTILLSDVKTGVIVDANSLKYNDNTVIPTEGRDLSSLRSVEMTILSTPRGGTYQITLPDGTRAWLNADTKISFPSQFIGKERKILLINGEVYFEVAKNKEKPFIVETSRQVVEVLGTHFNISAYKEEGSTKTTLLEGSVAVTSTRARPKKPNERAIVYPGTVLKPNQESVLNENNELVLKQVDASEAIAWKNGEFIFNDEPLESIMRKLARWYDVEVIYQGVDKDRLFGGGVSRYDNISKILNKMEKTGGIHFKIEGKSVTVTGK
ncbi:FecR family protein [Pedobacter heparinus]|uniref:FecR protein n=1 Tax=Pedobacter heparinus (strain ATCC 13125 / DSM 2366 / CIP 104194 / JCM 7457 / NBRC 12017 / NCIMB 9290 / NRRL B-14731 / HIM 762-3) TaxID=485917 RepID=C6Y2D3_PEDHD|nr:FecR family protein [Pedobacter heparinus]ACU03126.1 FecR protein [Pedobacter heparinus DSM 2366]